MVNLPKQFSAINPLREFASWNLIFTSVELGILGGNS